MRNLSPFGLDYDDRIDYLKTYLMQNKDQKICFSKEDGMSYGNRDKPHEWKQTTNITAENLFATFPLNGVEGLQPKPNDRLQIIQEFLNDRQNRMYCFSSNGVSFGTRGDEKNWKRRVWESPDWLPVRRQTEIATKNPTAAPPAPSHLVNAININDILTIGPELGKGSFGKVFEATLKIDIVAPNQKIIANGTKVALKVQELKDSNLKLLAVEAAALKRAMEKNCVNIVYIYDIIYDDANKKVYIIMELIAGENMDNLVKQNALKGKSEEIIIKNYIAPVVAGLQCLHDHRIAHRDLKLENIMFDNETKQTKLIDLGLSCMDICDGQLVGNLSSLAPEFFLNKDIKFISDVDNWIKADIWSLGCTIYSMMSGGKSFALQANLIKSRKIKDEASKILSATTVIKLPSVPAHHGKIRKMLDNWLQIDPKKRHLIQQ